MENKIKGDMLIKELVKAIANKEVKVKDLTEKYSASDRTIQNKIKKLGFVWDSKERRYEFNGNDDSVYNLTIDDVFTNKITNVGKENIETDNNKETEIVSKVASNNESDNIDRLLVGKKVKAKKEYRGFYFDSDVLAIIDNVNSGVKSELVNECLRKVFKEKGLL